MGILAWALEERSESLEQRADTDITMVGNVGGL